MFKNTKNCMQPTLEACGSENNELWIGFVGVEAVTLRTYIYNAKTCKMSLFEENQCSECRVIWAVPNNNCPICNKGDVNNA